MITSEVRSSGGADRVQPRDWLLVVGSIFALAVSTGPLFHFAFAVFVLPLAREFAADRQTVSLASTCALLLVTVATPALGWLTDRWGSRRVVLSSVPMAAVGLLTLAYLPTGLTSFIVIYSGVAVASLGTSTLPYVRAITRRFDSHRGLALGFCMSGIGIGVAVLPPLSQALIDAAGWRGAYAWLALVVIVVGLPAAMLLPHEPVATSATRHSEPSGEPLVHRLMHPSFLKLAAAFMLGAFAMSGVMAHLIAMLSDRGIAPDRAAAVMSIGGITLILGRVLAGYLLDKVFAPYLAVMFFLLPMAGLIILLRTGDTGSAWLATGLIGLGIGAEVDLIAFMVSRYFGLQSFGTIYGAMLTTFMAGNAAGPLTMGVSHTQTGSYDAALVGGAIALAAGSLLMLTLGEYRFTSPTDRPQEAIKG